MKTKILLAGILAIGMCACTTDDNLDGSGLLSKDGDAVYMQFKLQLPTSTSTRSETTSGEDDDYVTSSEGIEYGQDYENTVTKVNIVLTDTDNKYIAEATSYTLNSAGDNMYVAAFDAQELSEFFGQNVNVYLMCNSGYDLNGTYGIDEAYTLTEATDGTPWTNNYFYMSNAELFSTTLPTAEQISNYTTEANAYNIGTVDVERSMARFDYKDGSPTNNYTYSMGDTANIVLQELALINLSNEFYYVRRVSDNGLSTGDNYAVGGTEWCSNGGTVNATGNYVVDTDADYKVSYTSSEDGETEATHFFYDMQNPDSWKWDSFTSIEDDDNDDSWNNDNTYGDYHIWRYVTENTIPESTDTENPYDSQKKGITTGVVFKGQINITDDDFQDAVTASTDKTLYVYQNILYGTWEMIESLIAENEGDYPALEAAVEVYNDLYAQLDDDQEHIYTQNEALATAGFTGYTPDDDGNYYVYYYYWNRHNDNGNNGIMGVMEFDVVRNNVYKLSVTGINQFGHPAPGSDDPDPDPEEPDEPDETTDMYIRVQAKILPWVVRVNDITF